VAISQYLRKKAEETIDAMLAENAKEKKIEEGFGFFFQKTKINRTQL